jgi:hypothetical protein
MNPSGVAVDLDEDTAFGEMRIERCLGDRA